MSADFYNALTSRLPDASRVVTHRADNRAEEAYDDAYWAVMEGKDCAFYPTNEWRTAADSPEFDNEQELALFAAVKLAASLIGATDAERWTVVENALRAEAEKFAEHQKAKA